MCRTRIKCTMEPSQFSMFYRRAFVDVSKFINEFSSVSHYIHHIFGNVIHIRRSGASRATDGNMRKKYAKMISWVAWNWNVYTCTLAHTTLYRDATGIPWWNMNLPRLIEICEHFWLKLIQSCGFVISYRGTCIIYIPNMRWEFVKWSTRWFFLQLPAAMFWLQICEKRGKNV